MAGSIVRVGRVSNINYGSGTIEVTYYDRGQSVTRWVNALSNGVYKMPEIGQMVAVEHNSSGTAAGTVIGTVWNKTNPPAEGFEGLYRREMGRENWKAYDRYDDNEGAYTMSIDRKALFQADEELRVEVDGAVITIKDGGKVSVTSPAAVEINAPQVNIVGGAGDVTVDGVSLVHHTHTSAAPGEKTSAPA